MSSFRFSIAAALVFAVAACGFRPLYAPPAEDVSGEGVYAFDIFKSIAIDNIPDRKGQYFRNELVRLLHPGGRSGVARYRLDVRLQESTANLAVQRSAIATRANLTITAHFALRDLQEDTTPVNGDVKTISGYNIFQSEFQTLMAEKGARERALEDLAQQLRIRLAALLATNESKIKTQ